MHRIRVRKVLRVFSRYFMRPPMIWVRSGRRIHLRVERDRQRSFEPNGSQPLITHDVGISAELGVSNRVSADGALTPEADARDVDSGKREAGNGERTMKSRAAASLLSSTTGLFIQYSTLSIGTLGSSEKKR